MGLNHQKVKKNCTGMKPTSCCSQHWVEWLYENGKKICWENFEEKNFFQFRPFWKWEYLIKGLISTVKIKSLIHLSNIHHSGTNTVEFWGIQCSTGWKYVKSQIFDIFRYFWMWPVFLNFLDSFLPLNVCCYSEN